MTHTRRLFAFLSALFVAAIVLPGAPARAATPLMTINGVVKTIPGSYFQLRIDGWLTCAEPTGEATLIIVSGVQFMPFAFGAAGEETVSCAPGPVPWAVTVSSSQFHPGGITLNATFFSHGSGDSDSVNRTI